ncbi:hypothetical protein V1278_000323 [Bradyrhizobium sp. AZCC 1577]
MHGTFEISNIQIEPAILYFGTPVVLIGSTNEDGSFNLAPMSSAWWVGWRCMLGLAANSKTTENMIRTGECVLICRRPHWSARSIVWLARPARIRCRRASGCAAIGTRVTSLACAA